MTPTYMITALKKNYKQMKELSETKRLNVVCKDTKCLLSFKQFSNIKILNNWFARPFNRSYILFVSIGMKR